MRYLALATIASTFALFAAQPCAATEITSASGVFRVVFDISAKTPVPSGGQVWCHVRVFNPNGGAANLYADGNMAATLSGDFYICTMTLPFAWSGAVGVTTDPLTFDADAYILDTANTNLAIVTLNLETVRHAFQFGVGPDLIQGNNGYVELPTQAISL